MSGATSETKAAAAAAAEEEEEAEPTTVKYTREFARKKLPI